jgi:hypothetical protein
MFYFPTHTPNPTPLFCVAMDIVSIFGANSPNTIYFNIDVHVNHYKLLSQVFQLLLQPPLFPLL